MKFLKDLDIGKLIIPVLGIAVIGATFMTDRADQDNPARKQLNASITQESSLNANSMIAERNWKKCNFVNMNEVDSQGQEYFGRVKEGEFIVDKISQKTLPDDMAVCDVYGVYGVIKDGVATNVIVNQKVAKQAAQGIFTTQQVGE